jgi:hypothetical protein
VRLLFFVCVVRDFSNACALVFLDFIVIDCLGIGWTVLSLLLKHCVCLCFELFLSLSWRNIRALSAI